MPGILAMAAVSCCICGNLASAWPLTLIERMQSMELGMALRKSFDGWPSVVLSSCT